MDCVDGILRKSNSCPLDGYVIYNPLTWRTSERKTSHKLASCLSNDFAKPEHNLKDLFIPGVALRDRNTKTAPSHGSLNLEVLTGSCEPLNIPQKLISNQFIGLCITTTDGVTKEGKVLQKKLSKSDSGDRQNTCSPKKTSAEIREQPQVNLFVGSCRPESGHAAAMALPGRRTRPKPTRTSLVTTQDTNKKLVSELRMTGVMINTQQHRKTETWHFSFVVFSGVFALLFWNKSTSVHDNDLAHHLIFQICKILKNAWVKKQLNKNWYQVSLLI